jgi:hypothetical protein
MTTKPPKFYFMKPEHCDAQMAVALRRLEAGEIIDDYIRDWREQREREARDKPDDEAET